MRNVKLDTITQAFLGTCAEDSDPRLLFLLTKLVRHLHDFAREVNLTHVEWQTAISLLTRAGEMTDDERNVDLHRKSGEHQLKQEVFDGTRDQVYGGVQARGGAPGSDQWPATG